MNMRLAAKLVLVASLAFLSSFAAAQETTGTIAGTVTDSSGRVVADATVTVKNTDRNTTERSLKTNSVGQYVAALLPIGHYDVSIAAQGFKTFTKNGIILNLNDRLSVNAELVPGSVSEVVNVTAETAQVSTQSASAEGLISGTQIRDLALSARNYEELVALTPGVSSAVSDTIYVGVETPGGGTNQVSFSINGTRFSQNNWTIDGVDNVDRGGNFSLLNYPSVDAIDEFKVMRSLYDSEYGRGAGGQIAVITRSGTNKFHGGAYWFFRNDVLNANRFVNKVNGLDRPPLRYNDFGWTLGGPVFIPHVYNEARNKTFFFYSEELRRIVTYSTNQAVVPNAQERLGIFANDVCLTPFDPASTPGCTVLPAGTPALINPAAAAYLKNVYSRVPIPQDTVNDLLANTARNEFNYRQEIIRIDHNFNQKFSLTGRWINDSIPTINPSGLFGQSNVLGYATTDTDSPGHSLLIRLTATIRPTLLNEAGFAYSYGAITSNVIGFSNVAQSPDVASAIKLPFPSALPRIPNLGFQNGSALNGFGPYGDFNRNYNVFDNLAWVKGRHTWKFGIAAHRYSKSENDAGGFTAPNGSFSFPSVDPTGSSTFQQEFASFLTGQVSSFTQSSQDFRAEIRQHMFEWYVQDEFRLRHNLTINYGLRHTYYGQATDANNQNTSFNSAAYNPAAAPPLSTQGDPSSGFSVFVCTTQTGLCDPGQSPNPNFNALNGLIVSSSNASAIALGAKPSPYGGAVANQNYLNFAPRFGFAWDPFSDGKTAVRGGYGLFFDSPAVGYVENNLFNNPPFVSNITIANTVLDNPGSVAPTPDASPVRLKGVQPNFKLPYTQSFSLDVQHEFPRNLILDIGYYGNLGTHLIGIIDANQPVAGAALAVANSLGSSQIDENNFQLVNLVRPFKGYGPINQILTSFTSNYNSLQASVQKRFGSGVVAVSYTYSHALTTAGNDASTPQDSRNLRAEYGPADFDRRHIFTANYVYPLPWLKNQEGFTGHLLGGWEVSGIITYNSGLALTALGSFNGTDPAGLGMLDPGVQTDNLYFAGPQRPDQVADPNSGAPNQFGKWFNTDAFSDPPPGAVRPGNARRGSIKGPSITRWDMSLFKNIKITERTNLQMRFEGFNILNHTNFDQVDTTVSSSTFGQVLSTREPRIIQLGLKFGF
jgi:hypothetical protein